MLARVPSGKFSSSSRILESRDVIKGGETDNTLLIPSILAWAPELGSPKLIVDGAILVKGLKVHSKTTIKCLNSGAELPIPGEAVQCPIDGFSRLTTDSPCRDKQ